MNKELYKKLNSAYGMLMDRNWNGLIENMYFCAPPLQPSTAHRSPSLELRGGTIHLKWEQHTIRGCSRGRTFHMT